MKRLFIGVPMYCENALGKARAWQDDPLLNQNRLVWTKPSNWHITLVFLGASPEAAVSRLIPLIDTSFENTLAFTSNLNGVGVFPAKSKPNVLWISLDDLQPLLKGYHQLVETLKAHHFEFDSKPLKPHLTIARVKYLANRSSFEALLDNYRSFHFGKVDIDRVTLFESVSTPQGVKYVPLYEKRLLSKNNPEQISS